MKPSVSLAPTRPTTSRRRREGGIVLILAIFVITLLLVIVPQFAFSAYVERNLALNEVTELQMEQVARAAILRAQAGLLVDLEEDKSREEGGDDPLGGGGSGPTGGAGGAGGANGAGGAGGGAEDPGNGGGSANHTDSLNEPWAEGTLDFSLGEMAELKTRIYVTDEDSKLNLLLLAAEEREYRDEWRQRFERCLDLMRDGLPEDLAISESAELCDRIERWMRGDRQGDLTTTPKLQSGEWEGVTGESTHAPLSLAELALTGGISPRLLSGFLFGEPDDEPDDQKWVPGLAQTLTPWSNLEWKDVAAQEEKPDAAGGPKQARPEAAGVNNGRINVNTAPIWVLKSLFPDSEIPYSAWDEYEKFRKEQLDEIRKKREEARSGERRVGGDDEDRDKTAAKYPLKNIDDLRKVEGFTVDSSSITPQKWDKLAMLLSVESNVFTITVVVATLRPPARHFVARAVVWRRAQGGGDPRCLPIVNFERVPVSSVDLRAFNRELDDEMQYYE
jgi:type II secretory pathway component PulK